MLLISQGEKVGGGSFISRESEILERITKDLYIREISIMKNLFLLKADGFLKE